MPYGLGFNHEDINARCVKHFGPRHHNNKKKKLKIAGLKILKQKKTANNFNVKTDEALKTGDDGDTSVKETIIEMKHGRVCETLLIGGKVCHDVVGKIFNEICLRGNSLSLILERNDNVNDHLMKFFTTWIG